MIEVKNIWMEDFYKAKDIFLELSSPGVHAVIGRNLDGGSVSNGAGKSTIFEALCWALYGKTTRGKFEPENNCWVQIKLADENSVHIVQRGRKDNSPFLKIHTKPVDGSTVDDIELTGTSVANGSDIVQKLVGMDYDTFTRSVYFPQEGVIPFGYLTDKVLKEFFLEKFLDIGWISECYDRAKKDVDSIEKSIESSTKSVEALSYKISNLKSFIITSEEESDKWKAETAHRITQLEKEINENEKVLKEYADRFLDSQIEKMKNELIILKAKYSKYGKAEEKLVSIKVKYDRKLGAIKQSIRDAENETIKIDKKLGDMQALIGTKCQMCGNIINEEGLEEHRIQLELRRGELSEKNAMNVDSLDIINARINKISHCVSSVCERSNRVADQYNDLVSKLKSNPEEEKMMERLQVKVESDKKERIKLQSVENPYSKKLTTFQEELKACEMGMSFHESDLECLTKELVPAKFWMQGFGTQGIQSFLLETITPVLNFEIKKYLDMLSDGMLKAEFHTVKRLKSGEYRENFRLVAESLMGAKTYRGLSGGEKARVNLAVSLALGEMKRMQSEKQINLLILDEPFNGLDQEGVSDVLRLLKENFGSMPLFLISHIDVDPSLVDDLIVVKKENGISSILEDR